MTPPETTELNRNPNAIDRQTLASEAGTAPRTTLRIVIDANHRDLPVFPIHLTPEEVGV